MPNATYEFRYVSSKHKVQLILCKAFVMSFMLMCLASLIALDQPDYGEKLLYVSGVMNMCFAYTNLVRVKVEVQELFEFPFHYKAYEFFWLGLVFFVVSFFV